MSLGNKERTKDKQKKSVQGYPSLILQLCAKFFKSALSFVSEARGEGTSPSLVNEVGVEVSVALQSHAFVQWTNCTAVHKILQWFCVSSLDLTYLYLLMSTYLHPWFHVFLNSVVREMQQSKLCKGFWSTMHFVEPFEEEISQLSRTPPSGDGLIKSKELDVTFTSNITFLLFSE